MVATVDSVALTETIKAGLLREETDTRWRVLRCAEVFPNPSLLPVIIPFAHSTQVAERVHAYRALQRQQNKEAILAVMDGWNKHDGFQDSRLHRVQVAGLRALGSSEGMIFGSDAKEKIMQLR